MGKQSGELWWEAEIHRLKGTFMLSRRSFAESEACFQRSIRIAQRQQAKSLELRGATSLAQLWRDKGRNEQAHSCWRRSTAGSPKADHQGTFRPDLGSPLGRAIWCGFPGPRLSQNQHPNSRITSPAVIIPAIGFSPEGQLRYCCLGVFPANPARRNASAIASPLAGTGLLRPARVSADRKRFSDSVGGISARAVDGRASRA